SLAASNGIGLRRRMVLRERQDTHGEEGNYYWCGAGGIDGGPGVFAALGRRAGAAGGERRDRGHLPHDPLQGQPNGHRWPPLFFEVGPRDAVVDGTDAAGGRCCAVTRWS